MVYVLPKGLGKVNARINCIVRYRERLKVLTTGLVQCHFD